MAPGHRITTSLSSLLEDRLFQWNRFIPARSKILKIESQTHADIPRIVGVVCSILQAGKKVPSLARQVALKSPKNSLLGAALPGDLMSGEFGDWEIRLVATPSQGFEVWRKILELHFANVATGKQFWRVPNWSMARGPRFLPRHVLGSAPRPAQRWCWDPQRCKSSVNGDGEIFVWKNVKIVYNS